MIQSCENLGDGQTVGQTDKSDCTGRCSSTVTSSVQNLYAQALEVLLDSSQFDELHFYHFEDKFATQ